MRGTSKTEDVWSPCASASVARQSENIMLKNLMAIVVVTRTRAVKRTEAMKMVWGRKKKRVCS
jgi:hypothetical protein